jgi:hypothetical protein
MSRPTSDPVRAILSHAARVLATRHAERDKRIDLALTPDLAGRLGPTSPADAKPLIGVSLSAIGPINARRERDRLLAKGHTAQAGPSAPAASTP